MDRPRREPPVDHETDPAALINTVITSVSSSLRREARRYLLMIVSFVIMTVMVLSVGFGFVVVGAVHLGDALSRAANRIFGDHILADAVVGLTFMLVPVVMIVWLRIRSKN